MTSTSYASGPTASERAAKAGRGPVAAFLLAVLLSATLAGCIVGPPPGPATVSVTKAAWVFENPETAQHAGPDSYYLQVEFEYSSQGSGTRFIVGGRVDWNGANATPFAYHVVIVGGGSGNGTVYVMAKGLPKPTQLTLTDAQGQNFSAPVPDPLLPADEVVISVNGVRRVDAMRNGAAPVADFLWVALNLENRAADPISTSRSTFEILAGNLRPDRARECVGPASIGPGGNASFNLTFDLFNDSLPLKIRYSDGAAPWGYAELSAPIVSEPYHDARFTVLSAEWQFEDVAGTAADYGFYFLNIAFAVDNRGLGNFTSSWFTLDWADGNSSDVSKAFTWHPNEARFERLSFRSDRVQTPQTLQVSTGGSARHQAPVPAPAPLPVLIDITNLSSYWSDFNNCGLITHGSERFLNLAFTLRNHWHGNLSARSFWVVDANNSWSYNACPSPNSNDVLPGGAVPVVYSYGWFNGTETLSLVYKPANGPWLNLTLPPTSRTLFRYAPQLAVNSAVWRYENPYGYHNSRENYTLWVDLTITNAGGQSFNVQPSGFDIYWTNATPVYSQATWPTFTLDPGESANVTVGFPARGLLTPDHIEFEVYYESPPGVATVPTPVPPAPEVLLSNLTVAWNTTDPFNQTAASGNRFLWLELDFANLWSASIWIDPCGFAVVGDDGSQMCFSWRLGPTDVASGESSHFTLVVEVPDSWNPVAVRFDSYQGPWADATL